MHKKILYCFLLFCFSQFEIAGQTFYLKISEIAEANKKKTESLYYIQKHKDYRSIENEWQRLKQTIYKQGYINAKWQPLTKMNDSVFTSEVVFGLKVDSIKISFQPNQIPEHLLKTAALDTLQNTFVIPFSDVEKTMQQLNAGISSLGKPFNKLQLTNIQSETAHVLTAQLVVSGEKQPRYINNIVIKGYELFPKSYLKHYLNIKPGQVLNLESIKVKTDNLQELPFANKIRDSEILFSQDSTILYMYLEKVKSNAFDGFLGFGTNQETSKLELNGYLNLELVNNLNFGESLSLAYRSDENEQTSFQVTIKTPYLFNSPVGAEVALRIFKKDSSFTTTNQRANLIYQLNSKHSISGGILSTTSSNLLATTNLNPLIKDYTSIFYTANYQFRAHTKSGPIVKTPTALQLQIGTGNRNIKSQKVSQLLYDLEAFKTINLNLRNHLFLKAISFGLFSEDYLENELARFGGIKSIRGFEENSLTASLYGVLQTEYRYSLTPELYVHSITDLAYLENQINSQKEKLVSLGLGFALKTKAGLLQFNYATGKTENQNFKLANSKIHLSLSALF
ncbi:POTRA domain-containing protein [Bizionia sediminis]|uniref:POTRA domain-containing protein n=1 Tax=Bizionia sediminis TaxID=1737064 RepID=A0ABW5KTP0_9FLAO